MKSAQHRAGFRAGGAATIAALLGLLLVFACGETVEVGLDDPLAIGGTASGGAATSGTGGLQLGGSSTSGNGGTSGSLNEAGAAACVKVLCRGKPYKCGNCIDDDGDGLIDELDPDCLGPCDDDEVGLSTGLTTNQASACRQDCYFDGDNGPGNDKCQWSHSCDPLSLPPDYPPSGLARCKFDPTGTAMGNDCAGWDSTQPATCLNACLPLVPNGCDCFGCCELPRGSGKFHFIGVGRGEQGCQRDNLDDPLACPPCTQVKSCINTCDKCETCVGGPPTDPTCTPESACPADKRACNADKPCNVGDYCVTGCCVAPPPT